MKPLARHVSLVRRAYAAERSRVKDLVRTRETTFLPAALEIVERPVSPTGRLTARLLIGALVITSAWVTFGRVDMVASAQGELVPGGYAKVVQPATVGIVRAIHVQNAQAVKAGQLLMDLDPTVAAADVAQARAALQAAELDAARDRAELRAIAGGPLVLDVPRDIPADLAAAHRSLALQTVNQIRARNAAAVAEARSARAAYAEAAQQLVKIDVTLPLLEDEVGRYAELSRKGYVSQTRMLEIERQHLGAIKDRVIAQASRQRAAANRAAADHVAAQSLAEDKRTVLQDLARAEAEAAVRRQDLAKMQEKMRRQRLTSPADGVVTQLAVHTIGATVEEGKPIMTIVPLGGRILAEVKLLNRDVAHVHSGQPASLKVTAYPFTRFGTLQGRVDSVSADAVPDRKYGLVYIARISFDQHDRAARQMPRLMPGMEVVADIRTGKRTLLSYLLSPLRATAAEALRES